MVLNGKSIKRIFAVAKERKGLKCRCYNIDFIKANCAEEGEMIKFRSNFKLIEN